MNVALHGLTETLPVFLLGLPTAVAVGWALSVLGVTLLGFLTVDGAVGLLQRTRRRPTVPAR